MENFKSNDLNRYGKIENKNKREIILLRGSGCTWKKCTFCDYQLDYSKNIKENIDLNEKELLKITGIYSKLEVINSGSFVELPKDTIEKIKDICIQKSIKELYFEAHYSYKNRVKKLRELFSAFGIKVIVKTGIETFDTKYRESYLVKGIEEDEPQKIALYFDECCLLQGLKGQTKQSMINDIEIGLLHFQRVCVNIMKENSTCIKPDFKVIKTFINEVYPLYKDNYRVDILLENTDFGVG